MKISADGVDITKRFFEAINELVKRGKMRGLQTFTRRYGINYWNMTTLKNAPASHVLKPEWLYYIVRDYGVSPEWLLTGFGHVFTRNDTKMIPRQNGMQIES